MIRGSHASLLTLGACLSTIALADHQVVLKNGQQMAGVIQLPVLTLKTDVGVLEVPVNEVVSIRGSAISLGDGSTLKGSIVDKAVPLQTRYAVINVRPSDIRELVLASPAGKTRSIPSPHARSGSPPTEKELAAYRKQGSFMSPTTVTSKIGRTIGQNQADLTDGPKKRIAIRKFDNKTAVATNGQFNIGTGMVEMLTTALVNTGRFIILERQEMEGVIEEQNFGASGRVKGKTAAKIGDVEGAELLVYGAVTDYLADQSGAGVQAGQNAGVGIGALFGPIGMAVGAVAGALAGSISANKAHVAIDLRIVDARTGRVVSATSVEGHPKEIGANIQLGSFAIGGSTKTPIGMAIRDCMNNAVNWILITSFPEEKEKFLAMAAEAEEAARAAEKAKAEEKAKADGGEKESSPGQQGGPTQ